MRTNEAVTEKLRYRFTADEHLKNAEHLAAKFHEAGEMKQNHEAIKADLAEQKKRLEAEIGKYARLVSDGFDMRDVQCRWEFGRPSSSQKTLVRIDSGDDVRTEMMLDHERQEMLKLEMPSHVLAGPGALKDRKVSDIDDADIDYYASRDEDDLIKFGWIKVDVDAVFEEAKRRAQEKEQAAGPKLIEMPASPGTASVAAESSTVHESALQFVSEAENAEVVRNQREKKELADAREQDPGCEHCANNVPLMTDGDFHNNGVACKVFARNQAIANGEEPPAPATLAPAREAAGGTHAAEGKRQRRPRGAQPAPTAEEREQLDSATGSADNEPSGAEPGIPW